MTPDQFLHDILVPGLDWFEGVVGHTPPASREARVLMLAIAGQESNWSQRIQSGNGPAHGFWQFERGGGVKGVLTHRSSYALADKACAASNACPAEAGHVWGVLATVAGDNLAVAFARLLLWTDPKPLPAYGAEEAAYATYIHNWRPGKPSRSRWATVYPQALAADKAFAAGVKT